MSSRRQLVLGGVAHEIAARADPHRPTRVAIDGITAAGKTTFADELADLLRSVGAHVLRVSMDGFHNPRAVRYRQGRSSPAGYYEDAYDFAGLRAWLLDPLGPGGDRRYRSALRDLATDQPVDQGVGMAVAADDLTLIVDGSFLQRPELRDAWDIAVFLRCPFAAAERRGVARDAVALGGHAAARQLFRERYHPAQRRYLDEVDPEARADIVVDHRDPRHPTVRWLRTPPAPLRTRDPYVHATRGFFTPRAETWDQRFPDDDPALADAVAHLGLEPGGVALDVGCGTGRALVHLLAAVGPQGTVAGLDLTPAMAVVAGGRGPVVLGDARCLPLPDGAVDGVFAAGLLTHLPDPEAGLAELARITRAGGRLALFHPIGRRALAARHGHELDDADIRDPANLPRALAAAGWTLDILHDDPDRYLAVARRSG